MAFACICFIVLSSIPSAPIDLLFADEQSLRWRKNLFLVLECPEVLSTIKAFVL